MKKSLKALLIALVVSLSLGVITACKKTEEPKKTKLDAPVIASKAYTGSNQTATVPENEGYTVEANFGGTDVGEYDVVLTLSDKKKYEWTTPNADDKTKLTLKFAITKANNEITTLTLADWTYGEEPNAPAATAKFGTAVFTYSASENGEYTATVPTAVGSYFVKATVAGTANYGEATKTARFEIKKAAALVATAPTAKTLTYTGAAQELLTAGTANGGELQYKLGEDGEWGNTIPTEINAGEYKVYYKVVGDANHTDLTGDDLYVAVTVAKANANFATTPAAVSDLVYNGNAQTLATAGTANGGTVKYSLDNTNWSETLPTATNAGEYTVYYVITPDANHNAAAAESFKVTIAKAENNVTFSLGDLEIHCDSAIPTEFDATATAGTITYTYSSDNSAFYTAEELKNMSFKFEAGKTYYVKATAAESENYLSANKVAQITATHNHASETTDENGLTVLTCACGHKQVSGELNAEKTVNFAATVTEGAVSATAGELDISAVYGENSSATITVDGQEYANLGIVNGKITLKDVIPVTVYGKKAVGVKFSAADGDYNFMVNTLFITKMIETLTDLRTITKTLTDSDAKAIFGYYRLVNDIDCTKGDYAGFSNNGSGFSWGSSKQGFRATLDGDGKTITGFAHNQGLFNSIGEGAVIKNINFVSTRWSGTNDRLFGIASYGATFENVSILMKSSDGKGNVPTNHLLFAEVCQNNTFKNVTLKVYSDNGSTLADITTVFGKKFTGNTCEGVKIYCKSVEELGKDSSSNSVTQYEGIEIYNTEE